MYIHLGVVELETLISSVSTSVLGQRMSRRFDGREYAMVKLVIRMLPSVSSLCRHWRVGAHVSS